jgi:hypothetical protein
LILLVDCFYLPYEEGPEARRLLSLIERLLAEPVEDWADDYEQFSDLSARIQTLFERLTELRDRDLFDSWSRRVWALKAELQAIDAILAQKKAARDIVSGFESEHYLPGTFRGGVLAKLQRFLSMDDDGKIRIRQLPDESY